MTARDVLLLSIALLLYAIAAPSWASLPTKTSSYDNFHIALNDHRNDPVQDQTYYARPDGLRYLIVRLPGNSTLRVLLRDATDSECPSAQARGRLVHETLVIGSGCLVSNDGAVRIKLNYALHAPEAEARQLLAHVDPVVWLSGYDEAGNFQATASPLLALDSLYVRYPLPPNAP